MPASLNHSNIITNNNANICFLIIIHVSFYMENITVGWKVFRKIGGCTGNDSHDSHISTSHAVEIILGEAVIFKVSTSDEISWSYLVSACRAWAAFLRFSCFLSWKRPFYEVLQANAVSRLYCLFLTCALVPCPPQWHQAWAPVGFCSERFYQKLFYAYCNFSPVVWGIVRWQFLRAGVLAPRVFRTWRDTSDEPEKVILWSWGKQPSSNFGT